MVVSAGWTVVVVERLPQPWDDTRYEIIGGNLIVTQQPSYQHQRTCTNVAYELEDWDRRNGLGAVVGAPGVVFAANEAVAPDVAWVSTERLPHVLGDDGKLHAAPDVVVEVLPPGAANEERDRAVKVDVYSRRGVRDYWLMDWRQRTVMVFRHVDGELRLMATLLEGDTLESPLLPGFSCPVAQLFAGL
jgi:Uma2 family endonuclease